MSVHKITFSRTNWTGGTPELYFDDVSHLFFADSALTEESTTSVPPVRELYAFEGFYATNTASARGAQYINPDGSFTDDFWAKVETLTGTNALTIYAHGTQVSRKLTISPNGGTGGTSALYYAIDGSGWFEDYLCQGPNAERIFAPTNAGKLFRGVYSAQSGGTQYIDKSGALLPALQNLTPAGNVNAYAQWATPLKITLSANSGTGGDAAIYYNQLDATWSRTTDFSVVITDIVPYVRESYRLLGYKASNSDTAVERISASGEIDQSWVPTQSTTIYARWRLVSYKVSVAYQYGVGEIPFFYAAAGVTPNEFYYDDQLNNALPSLDVPTRSGYSLLGFFSAANGGTMYAARDGEFTPAFLALSITGAKTVYAQWKPVYKFTASKESGTGGDDAFFYDSVAKKFYADQDMHTQISSISAPTRECWAFGGYWSARTGGVQYVDADGDFTADLLAYDPTGNVTMYARWTRVSWKVTLNANGGEGGASSVYSDGSTVGFYADDQCVERISAVEMPSRTGYTVLGFYATATGGSRYIRDDGTIISQVVVTADLNLYAHWSANTYTLTFDYSPGTGSVLTKSVTFGQPVGALPDGQYFDGVFSGWMAEGAMIYANANWNIPRDTTAKAVYDLFFGGVTDYFGLGSSALVPESSTSGDEVHRVDPSNSGRMDNGVNFVGATWRNPSVTYRVVGDVDLNIVLGSAYRGANGTSGYMIVSVAVRTALGEFPTVTVNGTANEGADSINLFRFQCSVKARARAQNLMGCMAGSPDALHEVDLTASCTPVVLEELGSPCASDIVDGVLGVSVRAGAYMRDAAPAPANGFYMVTGSADESGTSRLERSFTLRRAMA